MTTILRYNMETMEKEKNRAIQYLANMDNQAVPQKYITGGTSGGNISTITSTSSSNNQIVESPRSFVRTPQHRDRVTTIVTVEQTTKKSKSERNDKRDYEDRSKNTATTIGTESQTEQSSHDLENGVDSKQYHDVQKGSEGPPRH